MLSLVVDWSEINGLVEVFFKVLLIVVVSPVGGWG